MIRAEKKTKNKAMCKGICHLSNINFIIDNFLEDYSKLSSHEIKLMLWRELDKSCVCKV